MRGASLRLWSTQVATVGIRELRRDHLGMRKLPKGTVTLLFTDIAGSTRVLDELGARRILIVMPADLQTQWRDEMRDKFRREFLIVDRDLVRDLRRRRGIYVNPRTHFPRLITSMDYLKRGAAAPLPRDAAGAGRAALPAPVRPGDRRRGA